MSTSNDRSQKNNFWDYLYMSNCRNIMQKINIFRRCWTVLRLYKCFRMGLGTFLFKVAKKNHFIFKTLYFDNGSLNLINLEKC